ncbi:Os03g0294975 [Oryza sativa Japonica Group]|uniref:Os03g0294975 protein n=1 Tax=Oryza sativa subsp. japonica TaxID=39947 RepID=A0A0P0VWE0_ORYSJ|nr:hypothetical protein EE612_016826 [Oryza sativa]BAS83706.1 Os03g0294975 [Oryza sativa Japonica Group]
MQNEYGLAFIIFLGLPSFSSVIPWTSEKTTRSPSWNSRRSSSTQDIIAGLSLLMDAIIPVCGSSPSTSRTVNLGPKSQNTLPKRPQTSALIKEIEGWWLRQ